MTQNLNKARAHLLNNEIIAQSMSFYNLTQYNNCSPALPLSVLPQNLHIISVALKDADSEARQPLP